MPASTRSHSAATVLFLLLAGLTRAQSLSVTVSPNPAPPGASITVTARDATGLGLFTPFGCLLSAVRSGTPSGPIVAQFPCTFLPGAIPPCGSATPRTGVWNSGAAAPGLYWFEIQHSVGMFGATTSEFHSVVIEGASPVPVLSASGAATWGNPFPMSLLAPPHAGEVFFVALSLSTNTGIPLGGGQLVTLDPDALFFLTFPSPVPGLFTNFQGVLDASGSAGAILINFPSSSGCLPFRAQAAMVDGVGAVTLSNDLHITVQ